MNKIHLAGSEVGVDRGGLLRSQGGWSQVMGMRRREQESSDERILGSGAFVEGLLRKAEDRELRQLRIKRTGKTIAEIIEEKCKARSVSAYVLLTPACQVNCSLGINVPHDAASRPARRRVPHDAARRPARVPHDSVMDGKRCLPLDTSEK